MRTRLALWAVSMLSLHGGIAGNDPRWPAVDATAQVHSNAGNPGVATPLSATRIPLSRTQDVSALPVTELVRQVPICIVWNEPWAGELGQTLLFQVHEVSRNMITVGYFAYWSTERPWGNNALTRWLVPALAIDAFYSHLFFVLPGIQRFLYGPGDIEGVRIRYQIRGPGQLIPISIVADNEQHREERIDVSEAVDESGRILLFNEVWSHQLGGHNAVALARAGARCRCYEQAALRRLTDETAAAFRMGSRGDPRRAGPAWAAPDVR